ncbi:hypothetical protein WBG83_03815 [Paenibacillus sp. y28]
MENMGIKRFSHILRGDTTYVLPNREAKQLWKLNGKFPKAFAVRDGDKEFRNKAEMTRTRVKKQP